MKYGWLETCIAVYFYPFPPICIHTHKHSFYIWLSNRSSTLLSDPETQEIISCFLTVINQHLARLLYHSGVRIARHGLLMMSCVCRKMYDASNENVYSPS